jgi:hypothetical protein
MIKPGFVILSFILLSLTSCEKKNTHRYPPTQICHNLTLSSSNLHENDRLYLLYDTRLLMRERIDVLDAKHFDRSFCNKYRNQGTLRLVIRENKAVIIDTSLRIAKPKYGYKIDIDRTKAHLTLVADTVNDQK